MLYWAIGYDEYWNRDIGFSVSSACDHPDCTNTINRGVSNTFAVVNPMEVIQAVDSIFATTI